MASNWTRREVIRIVRELSKIGILKQVRPGLLLLPAFRSALGQPQAGQSPILSDVYGGSPPDLTQMALDTISNYVQATTDAVTQTSADLAALPLAAASPETVGQYLSRL
jgi:hypothetical protein